MRDGIAFLWRLKATIGLTFLAHAMMLAAYLILLWGMVPEAATTFRVAAAILVVMFAASLPISFSGWGVRELSAISALAVIGIEPSVATAAALWIGLISLTITLIWGGASFYLLLDRDHTESERPTEWDEHGSLGPIIAVLAAMLIFFQIKIPVQAAAVTINIADPIALTGLVYLCLHLWKRRTFCGVPWPLRVLFACVSLSLIIGIVVAIARFGGNEWGLINRGVGWLFIVGYMSLGIVLSFSGNQSTSRIVLKTFIVAGSIVAAFQIVLATGHFAGIALPNKMFEMSSAAFANNANAHAFQMISVSIAAVLAIRLHLMGRVAEYALILVGVALYFAQSRTGYALFVLVLVYFILSSRRRIRDAVTSARVFAAALAIGLLLPNVAAYVKFLLAGADGVIPKTTSPVIRILAEQSDSERWQSVVWGWQLWLHHPIFGGGLGAFVHDRVANGQSFLVIHSVPIWLLSDLGILGFALIASAFAVLLYCCLKHRSNIWMSGTLILVSCYAIGGLVHDLFFQRVFWFLLGLFVINAPNPSGFRHREAT